MPRGDDAFIIGGNGTVGKATAKALNIPHYFDLKESNITLKEGSKKLFCFICLPTPTDGRGVQQGVDVIRSYVKQLKEYGGRNIFVIRSTVLPGTCKSIAKEFNVMVASNPEFLSEDTWERDAEQPRIIVIGADDVPTMNALASLWKGVKTRLLVKTDTVTSETLKYAFNGFFTTKIVWANTIYDYCQIVGANYKVIRDALHKHPWGSKHHLKAIHKDGRGAGGKCFPKDIHALSKNSSSEFFKLVKKLNGEYLRKSGKE